MSPTVHYYFAPNSPWTYLGHQRFAEIAAQHGATVLLRPVDLGGKVFPVSGGLPLAQRAPQRQAYRLTELRRFSEWLHAPLNPQPKFFPVNPDDAARLIIAVDDKDGPARAMDFALRVMQAVWVQERNIAHEGTLAELLSEAGLPAARLEDGHSQAAHERYEQYTREAIEAGVFGAPSYVVDGEIFWGQDRLDFVERRLAGA
jgi:2-hydroxychromene-2-carboxylate isomerase